MIRPRRKAHDKNKEKQKTGQRVTRPSGAKLCRRCIQATFLLGKDATKQTSQAKRKTEHADTLPRKTSNHIYADAQFFTHVPLREALPSR